MPSCNGLIADIKPSNPTRRITVSQRINILNKEFLLKKENYSFIEENKVFFFSRDNNF